MRKIYYSVFLLILSLPVQSQIIRDGKLTKQLEKSRYLRTPMQPDTEDAGFTRWRQKEVFKSRDLLLIDHFDHLQLTGPGKLYIDRTVTVSGKGSVCLEVPASLENKNPTNRSYATPQALLPLTREDLRDYNRFSAWVYVDAPGVYLVFGGFALHNDGEKIMPAPGRFEGQHFETFTPGKWQQVIWEIPDLYRDGVTGFSFCLLLAGEPAGASNQMKMYVDDMRIEKVEAENSRGFNLRKNAIAYSHSGYKAGAKKQALVQNVQDGFFKIYERDGGF